MSTWFLLFWVMFTVSFALRQGFLWGILRFNNCYVLKMVACYFLKISCLFFSFYSSYWLAFKCAFFSENFLSVISCFLWIIEVSYLTCIWVFYFLRRAFDFISFLVFTFNFGRMLKTNNFGEEAVSVSTWHISFYLGSFGELICHWYWFCFMNFGP